MLKFYNISTNRYKKQNQRRLKVVLHEASQITLGLGIQKAEFQSKIHHSKAR